MRKDYRGATKINNGLVYPALLPYYLGQKVSIVFANPDSKPYVKGILTRRKKACFVGNRAASLGDGIHSEDMQTFTGFIEIESA